MARVEFDLLKRPTGKALALSVSLTIACVALAAAPSFVPPTLRERQRNAASAALVQFELADPLNPGQFHRFARPTDTFPDDVAGFMAISAAKSLGRFPFAKADNMLKVAERRKDDAGAEALHLWARVTVSLGGHARPDLAERVAALAADQGFGFRPTPGGSAPTLFATYHALSALSVSGERPTSEVAEGSQRFLLSLQDHASGGFAEIGEEAPSVRATWAAVMSLLMGDSSGENVTLALAEASRFVFSCRTADGGFTDVPTHSAEERALAPPSKTATAAMALQVAAALKKLNIPFPAAAYATGLEYVAAAITSGGVVEYPTSDRVSLDATYFVAELLATTEVPFGYPRRVMQALSAGSLVCAALVVVTWYRKQMGSELYTLGFRTGFVTLAVLAAPEAVLSLAPELALPAYLAAMSFLVFMYYRTQIGDDDNTMNTTASFVSTGYLALVTTMQMIAPLAFTLSGVWIVLVAWSGASAVAIAYLACYFIGARNARFWFNTAILAWIINVLGTVMMVFSRDVSMLYRVMTLRSQRELVMVVYPFLSLILTQLGTALGFSLYPGPAGGKLQAKKLLFTLLNIKPKRF